MTDDTEYNGLGIWWKNSDQSTAFSRPEFEIYCQSLSDCPDTALLRWLRKQVAAIASGATPVVADLPNLVTLNSSTQRYPRLKGTTQYDLQYVYSFVTAVPIVVSSMPVFSTIMMKRIHGSSRLPFSTVARKLPTGLSPLLFSH
jgi:hypothetical protein